MAYQRIPETVEIRLVFNCVGKEVSCLFYAQKTGGYGQSDIDGLAGEIDNAIAPGWAALMSTYDAYVRTVVRGLDAENDLEATVNTSATAGSIYQVPFSNNVAFCLRQLSAYTGRSARGRTYFPGITRNAVTSSADQQDVITTSYANGYLAAVDGVRIAIDNYTTWDPVLVSRYNNGTKRAEGITFDWINTDYTTLKLATRRDRLR